jgi:hypothetical protein
MKSLLLSFLSLLIVFSVSASAVSPVTASAGADGESTLMVAAIEQLTGRKMTMLEKWQLKLAKKKLERQQQRGLFPETEELTEGFQPLPFFGSILTLGLLYGVMLFTAKDANALRWSYRGFFIAWLAFLAIGVAFMF